MLDGMPDRHLVSDLERVAVMVTGARDAAAQPTTRPVPAG